MILVLLDNLLEILIFILRNFTKLPVLRYLDICNVLHIWHIRAIPTYRVYRLYDSCIISQFLDESSNLKTGCKKDVVHDTFDAIYVSHIDNRSRDFLCHLRPVVLDTVRSLPPEPVVLCAHALHEWK